MGRGCGFGRRVVGDLGMVAVLRACGDLLMVAAEPQRPRS